MNPVTLLEEIREPGDVGYANNISRFATLFEIKIYPQQVIARLFTFTQCILLIIST